MPIYFLAIGIILLDQISKFLIENSMELGDSLPVIEGIFHITYILNPGAAFGILENQRLFFILIATIMILMTGYIYPLIPQKSKMLRLGVGMLFGGAVGNLIDRIRTGLVVDFFDFKIWPIFNIADIFIVVGVGMIIITMFYADCKMKGEKNE
ncbi:signal peptidase II [Anaerosinus gibii]|uniref:Lipoprotein signal peptidase n=1 Tax=Selenobaculum gibii TaxID=3054208 RepID=A0A9Y2ALA5_9FIRM|nr:signal peptidase II [Selenobaculum gbiensis]WIW71820.1 signal peptidase II [Selenobaculum gbiensis]